MSHKFNVCLCSAIIGCVVPLPSACPTQAADWRGAVHRCCPQVSLGQDPQADAKGHVNPLTNVCLLLQPCIFSMINYLSYIYIFFGILDYHALLVMFIMTQSSYRYKVCLIIASIIINFGQCWGRRIIGTIFFFHYKCVCMV